MVNCFVVVAATLVAFTPVASAASMRAEAAAMPTGSWPSSKGNEFFTEPHRVKKGEVFDGGMKTFQRSDISCAGQTESGWETSVFVVEAGGTLKNVIIGKNQMDGVHCEQSGCTIQNVWWDDVCEDALSIKGGSAGSVSKVIGGGARSASDKVVQHNGLGTVSIEGFYVQDFGKLYRSCGTCGQARKVVIKNVYAVNGRVSIATVNKNWGDQATLENVKIKGKKVAVCAWGQGKLGGGEPDEEGSGPSGLLCNYSPSTITYV